jgi:hypothetical protein
MLATIYDKNNVETMEQNNRGNVGHEWKNNHVGHITVVW